MQRRLRHRRAELLEGTREIDAWDRPPPFAPMRFREDDLGTRYEYYPDEFADTIKRAHSMMGRKIRVYNGNHRRPGDYVLFQRGAELDNVDAAIRLTEIPTAHRKKVKELRAAQRTEFLLPENTPQADKDAAQEAVQKLQQEADDLKTVINPRKVQKLFVQLVAEGNLTNPRETASALATDKGWFRESRRKRALQRARREGDERSVQLKEKASRRRFYLDRWEQDGGFAFTHPDWDPFNDPQGLLLPGGADP